MGDIQVPHSLSQADAVLNLSASLQKLLDGSARKSLESDVIALHALNDTEAKKAQEARDTIKKNSDILEETRRLSSELAQGKKSLAIAQEAFNEEKRVEYQKIEAEKQTAKDAFDAAQLLHDETANKHNDIIARESQLNIEKAKHAESVDALIKEREKLNEERTKIEEQKQAILDLDRTTKAKVEALKKFNF